MSVFLELLGTQSGTGGTYPCALVIPIGEVVRGHVHLHLRCQMRAIHVKVKPQCDFLKLWPSVLWTSCNGITLKFLRNTGSGAHCLRHSTGKGWGENMHFKNHAI